MSSGVEFDRQVANLIERGYPDAAGLSADELVELVEPLRRELDASPSPPAESTSIPFVLVVSRDLVAAGTAIELVRRRGEPATSMFDPEELARFVPIAGVDVPPGPAHLIVGVETGSDTLNAPPEEALIALERGGRSPLTIEEGVALVTHFPEAVARNAGFSLPGSRCGDRRVAALWISQGRPKLGWCWAGAPHTWLGSASCEARVGRHV